MIYTLRIETREPNPLYVPPPQMQFGYERDDRPPQHREQFTQYRVCEVELTAEEYDRVRHAIIDSFNTVPVQKESM